MTSSELTSRYAALAGQRALLVSQERESSQKALQAQQRASLLLRCLDLCRAEEESARDLVAGVIGPLCTAALQDVFGPEYELRVVHDELPSGKRIARLIASDGRASGNPMTIRGGSVVNVLSVFLPISISLLRPQLVPPIFIMDEPLGGVGSGRLDAVAEALHRVTHDPEYPVQVILTTQQPEPYEAVADTIISVARARGEVQVFVRDKFNEL